MNATERERLRREIDREVRAKLARESALARATRRPAGERFLLEALVDGPRPARELILEAKREGITVYRLRRARHRLGVVGFRDPTLGVAWSLREAA